MSELIEFSQFIFKAGCVCAPYRDTPREPIDPETAYERFTVDELNDLKEGVVPAEIVIGSLNSGYTDYPFVAPRKNHVEKRDIAGSGLCVFRNFVDAPPTAEGAVKFSNAYGFLLPEYVGATPSGFFLIQWLAYQEQLKRVVDRFLNGGIDAIADDLSVFQKAKFSGRLIPGKPSQFVLQPPSLWAYMWLEFGLHISNQTGLRQCEWCGTWFPFGTGLSRRKTAKFCGDKCRKASHAHAKKQTSS
jgi:hypothetical protein